jgi:diguanylate cyclase (GGDEF)-like protein
VTTAAPSPLRWALPEGALLGAAAVLASLDAAWEPLGRFGPFFACIVAAAALLLGARYQRSRLAFAVILLAAAAGALAIAGGGAPADRVVFQATALLLPLNLAVLPWSLERGIVTPPGLARLGAIAAQGVAVTAYATAAPETALVLLDARVLPSHVTSWTAIGDLGLLAFAAAGLLLVASFAFAGGAARRPWLWALVACFLALHAERPGPVPTLYLATAGLMLVVATVEQTFAMAYHDGLTGLPARRALTEALPRLGARYAIAMVDVDHFKQLNDTHGHDTGDQVLRMVATHLARVREGGRAYRYGGEEFTLVFADRGVAEVAPELERLRAEIAGAGFATRRRLRPRRKPAKPRASRSASHLTVTVSIGAAGPDGRRSPDDVIRAADKALYRAKKTGRNRVET